MPVRPDAPSRPRRLLVALVAAVCRRPRLTLAVAGLFVIASLVLAGTRLGYRTQRNDLIGERGDGQRRWRAYVAEFGEDDDAVILAEAADAAAAGRLPDALAEVARRLRAMPERFDRVFQQVDLRTLRDRSLLYLSTHEIRTIQARLEPMSLLLGPAAPVTWRTLTLDSLMMRAAWTAEQVRAGRPADATERALLERLPPLLEAATDALADPSAYRNPWQAVAPRPVDAAALLETPRPFLSADGTLGFLVARPLKQDGSFTPAKEAVAALRGVLDAVRPLYPELRFGLTGLPVLENDEMAAAEADGATAAWLALAGVAVLYLAAYRSPRYPALTIVTLMVGTAWALGWLTLTVGHLNILTATFAVMLIGLGDYGVLWAARYEAERLTGATPGEAARQTALHAGPGVVTAAATTSLAFFAAALADFRAVAELGWIAGCGVLLCGVSCLTVMPALLTLTERRRESAPANVVPIAAAARLGAWLPGAARRPRLVLGGALALVGVAGVFALGLRYDHNLLHMQAANLESVAWQHRLMGGVRGAGWHAVSVADNPARARELRAAYERDGGVCLVAEAASLVPEDQSEKLPLLASLSEKLAFVPRPDAVPGLPPADPPALLRRASRLLERLDGLADAPPALRPALERFRDALARDPADARHRLSAFQARAARDLATDLDRLRGVCRAAPITAADLPQELRERYVGASGKWLVRAFAAESLWEFAALERFVAAARTIDPEATGRPFGTLEGLRGMKAGFAWAGLYALIAITAVLAWDFRSVRHVALALLPLGVGVVWCLGSLGAVGLDLNPANLIALPLVVGVGVDHGVHVLHDYRAADRRRPYRLGAAVGRGVFVAALTTVLGFGALAVSSHRGQAGLGVTLALGVSCCLAASLLVLPAALRLLDERRLGRAGRPALPAAGERRKRA